MNASTLLAEDRTTVRNLFDQFDQPLEAIRQRAGADVVVFYLACDPFLPGFLRCIGSVGELRYPEACSHFRVRPDTPLPPSQFNADATTDSMRSGLEDSPLVEQAITARNDPIFGDFVRREGIRSRGWFVLVDQDTNQELALLTVSFRSGVDSDAWQRFVADIQNAFRGLVAKAAEVQRILQERCHDLYPAFIGMLELIDPVRHSRTGTDINQRLQRILQRAIAPLDSDTRHWCGSIHLLDRDEMTLELAASFGDFPPPERASHRIDQGEGVISWVALRRQAIRIRDLPRSPFRHLHVEYLTGVRSQLVVPILSSNGLLGTLSLETTEPDAFRFQTVGYLSRVASLVATHLLLSRYREERDRFEDAIYYHLAKGEYDRSGATTEELIEQGLGPTGTLP